MIYLKHLSSLKHCCCRLKSGDAPSIHHTQNVHHPFIFQSLHQLHQKKEKTSFGADIAFTQIGGEKETSGHKYG